MIDKNTLQTINEEDIKQYYNEYQRRYRFKNRSSWNAIRRENYKRSRNNTQKDGVTKKNKQRNNITNNIKNNGNNITKEIKENSNNTLKFNSDNITKEIKKEIVNSNNTQCNNTKQIGDIFT